eukprot:5667926-Pleurochrysis_carterae.AAC.2
MAGRLNISVACPLAGNAIVCARDRECVPSRCPCAVSRPTGVGRAGYAESREGRPTSVRPWPSDGLPREQARYPYHGSLTCPSSIAQESFVPYVYVNF